MKQMLFTAILIAAIAGAAFYFFVPKESTQEDMLGDLKKSQSSFTAVADYFIKYTEQDAKYIYVQDADNFTVISKDIKNVLDKDFLYIGLSEDRREVEFGTSSKGSSNNHKLIYSPYDRPKSESTAEMTKYSGWYIKM